MLLSNQKSGELWTKQTANNTLGTRFVRAADRLSYSWSEDLLVFVALRREGSLISASLRNYLGNQGVGVNSENDSYLHDCKQVNP